jgi:hypothetical protein
LSVTYGIDVKSIDDQFLSASLEASDALESAVLPGKFLVDAIPIRACVCIVQRVTHLMDPWTVRYLPDWFPGTGFKAVAKEARDKYEIAVDGALEYVKNTMKVGSQSVPRCLFQTNHYQLVR